MSYLQAGVLLALLAAAAWVDARNSRIPNVLVFSGAALGMAMSTLLPDGQGGLDSVEGLVVGLLLLLPLYLLRAMCAGDVKLMAMVGAFLGPVDVLGAAMATFMLGGAMAVLLALKKGVLPAMLRNLRFLVIGSVVELAAGSVPRADALTASAARMPYGIAIAAGTAAFLAWQRLQG